MSAATGPGAPIGKEQFTEERYLVAMENRESHMCAHEPCQCSVPADEKYCSDYCKSAGSEEVEIACDCEHEPCK